MTTIAGQRPGLAGTGAAIALGLGALYVTRVRPWTMRWGATADEVARPMRGDDLVRRADYNATRAITIHAPPAAVWPWLVQIGSGRAGWYSYDRLDNGGVPSAEALLPQFQHRAVGDLVPMIPGKEVGPRVTGLEPPHWMLWADKEGTFTWEWQLTPLNDGQTRLVTRLRETRPPWTSPRILYALIASSGDIVMMRKLLRGVKWRAERLALAQARQAVAHPVLQGAD